MTMTISLGKKKQDKLAESITPEGILKFKYFQVQNKLKYLNFLLNIMTPRLDVIDDN